jgi:hypothetical protein
MHFMRKYFARSFFLATAIALTGCANFYVDGNTQEVKTSEFKKPSEPRPAQLVFEFQTKGVLNARATQLLQQQVVDQVKASQLFSDVETQPTAHSNLLSIRINNVPISDDAFAKGFVTGLTFGLAGSKVSDGYICTATYLKPGSVDPVVKTTRHAIHTTLGAAASPGNATKAENIEDAVRTMVRQVVSNVLNDLSKDPSFQ